MNPILCFSLPCRLASGYQSWGWSATASACSLDAYRLLPLQDSRMGVWDFVHIELEGAVGLVLEYRDGKSRVG